MTNPTGSPLLSIGQLKEVNDGIKSLMKFSGLEFVLSPCNEFVILQRINEEQGAIALYTMADLFYRQLALSNQGKPSELRDVAIALAESARESTRQLYSNDAIAFVQPG